MPLRRFSLRAFHKKPFDWPPANFLRRQLPGCHAYPNGPLCLSMPRSHNPIDDYLQSKVCQIRLPPTPELPANQPETNKYFPDFRRDQKSAPPNYRKENLRSLKYYVCAEKEIKDHS